MGISPEVRRDLEWVRADFAALLLTAGTRPYSWLNYIGSVGGARLLGLGFARRMMDADPARLLHWADAGDRALARGCRCPPAGTPTSAKS